MRLFRLQVAVATVLFASSAVAFAQTTQTSKARVEASLQNILNLDRPGQDGYATIWDGNKYVQCKRLPDRGPRCEAAGALMQPSLERVLTPERVGQLATLGWRLDPGFGNYVQTFPAGIATGAVAEKILQFLAMAYNADAATLQVESRWVKSELCPPRNGPTQNLAGMVNDAPSMAARTIHACAYKPKQNTAPNLPLSSAGELFDFYGVKVTNEIQRLRVNIDRDVSRYSKPASAMCNADRTLGRVNLLRGAIGGELGGAGHYPDY